MTLAFYALAVLSMIAVPAVAGSLARRRLAAPWWLFCAGMVTFVASQAYHLPLNHWLADVGLLGPVSRDEPGLLRTALVVGLSAGLCESLARTVGYWILFRQRGKGRQDVHGPADRWGGAVMVGLGHGGVEAMILAVVLAATIGSLWELRGRDLSTLSLQADQLAALQQQLQVFSMSPWHAAVPLLERGIAMLLHVVLSVLVWSAFQRRRPLYLLAAVLYHATFDALAVYVSQFIHDAWLIEGLLFLFVLPGAAWVWASTQGNRVSRAVSGMAWTAEWKLFGTSLHKELVQQWRSRRALVVGVVFLVLGMGSPLLARFTPEMLRMVPGAEQFADLVPTPTTADALGQYVKNLTQFGFILALLLGMGAVAGEREKGITALILSKPLPRWAFLLAKFVAQASVYMLAFMLAALGAAYYTSVLFEPLTLGPFLFGNLLLWVWLLTFAAVTLLGSTLASSTGVAAGIGFGGSVALLLAGSVPRYGALAPAGLVGWASQLGLDAPGSAPEVAAGGALAAAAVWILVCLIVSVAVFETQEL